jgi:RNA polymerase sigma-70 factor (ECF subfamily)
MAMRMAQNSSETNRLLRRAASGDQEGLGALLLRHRARLLRLITLRLNPRLQGRIDPGDMLQDVFLEAARRLPEYLDQPRAPFYLWLRTIAGYKLLELHRYHLGTEMRDAAREVSLNRAGLPEASSAALAAQLLGRDPSPSEAAARAEMRAGVQQALDGLDPTDREVLVLRHFEHLSTQEIAQILEISAAAAGKRYFRALKRLKDILAELPGGTEEPSR